jgi:uncharacterized protein (TIGR00255 family)
MTGYGKAETVGEGFSVTVELKSVNNRFLEFQVRASKNILPLEPRLKQELGRHLTRGSVNCHVQYDSNGPGAGGIALNEPVFRAYAAIIAEAQKRLGYGAVLDVADLLKLPDMVIASEASEPSEIALGRILPVFERGRRAGRRSGSQDPGLLPGPRESESAGAGAPAGIRGQDARARQGARRGCGHR